MYVVMKWRESKDYIEQIIGKRVEDFSPPFGVISQRIYNLCVEHDYKFIYIQKHEKIKKTNGVELIKRHNVYSIDRNRNISKKLNNDECENRKENFISAFNNLTIFFKKIIDK